jgi:hypothetical protein
LVGWFTPKEQRKVVRIITGEAFYLPASALPHELKQPARRIFRTLQPIRIGAIKPA